MSAYRSVLKKLLDTADIVRDPDVSPTIICAAPVTIRGSILLVHSASALDLFKQISSNEPARIGNNLHFGWEEVAISFRLPQTHA